MFAHLHNIFVDLQGPEQSDVSTLDFTADAAKRFAHAREATTLVYPARHPRRPVEAPAAPGGACTVFDRDSAVSRRDRRRPDRRRAAGIHPCGVPLRPCDAARLLPHQQQQPGVRPVHQGRAEPIFVSRQHAMEPMPASWLVQWSNFFNVPGITEPNRINLSRRIGPATPLSLSAPALGADRPVVGCGDLLSRPDQRGTGESLAGTGPAGRRCATTRHWHRSSTPPRCCATMSGRTK